MHPRAAAKVKLSLTQPVNGLLAPVSLAFIPKVMDGYMHSSFNTRRQRSGGTLRRLAHDRTGNVFMITAAALIPIAGLAGGAMDSGRMYLAKTRMQQACDAGALAGRRQMGTGAWDFANYRARSAAETFFDANFQEGSYGTGNLTRSFTEAGGKVTGSANVVVPMTLMRVLGVHQSEVSVTCDAELRIPNVDVMFVLDVTGSMNSDTRGENTGERRIVTLKFATKCFYEAVARLDIDDVSCAGVEHGGTGNQADIRFGFVPYSTNVNVARLITSNGTDVAPTSMVAREWDYQTRFADYSTPEATAFEETERSEEQFRDSRVNDRLSPNDCRAWGENRAFGYEAYNWTPSLTGNPATVSTGKRYRYWNTVDDKKANAWWFGEAQKRGGLDRRFCKRRVITEESTIRYRFTRWIYKKGTLNLGDIAPGGSIQYLSGRTGTVDVAGVYSPVEIINAPGARGLTTQTFTWTGCIEERATVWSNNLFPAPAGAYDLDFDSVPSSGDPAARKWKVSLENGPIYNRGTHDGYGGYDINEVDLHRDAPTFNANEVASLEDWPKPSTSCPTAAQKMQSFTPGSFKTYVNGLTPSGGTYHDIGLLWGARLLSPDGMYAATNAQTVAGGNRERHIIFMTDGQTELGANKHYGTYGHRWFDRRLTNPAAGHPTLAEQRDEIDKRTAALCRMVRNKNITLWTVVFGDVTAPKSGLNQDIITNMKNCASSGKAYVAATPEELNTVFRQIAAQIGQLRLTN